MPQSTVQISTNEQREFYYNALIKKISDFKRFKEEVLKGRKSKNDNILSGDSIDILIREAISLKNLFDIKTANITLTRDDVNLLTRILNTSA